MAARTIGGLVMAILAIVSLACSSCAPERRIGAHATFEIDRDFGAEDLPIVIAGIEAWEHASPDVAFAIETRPHGELGRGVPENTVRIVVGGEDCTQTAEGAAASYWHGGDDAGRMCIDMRLTRKAYLQRVVSHEIGHALGFRSNEPDENHDNTHESVMHTDYGACAPAPTCLDVERVGLHCRGGR